jgi:hypothetical protein
MITNYYLFYKFQTICVLFCIQVHLTCHSGWIELWSYTITTTRVQKYLYDSWTSRKLWWQRRWRATSNVFTYIIIMYVVLWVSRYARFDESRRRRRWLQGLTYKSLLSPPLSLLYIYYRVLYYIHTSRGYTVYNIIYMHVDFLGIFILFRYNTNEIYTKSDRLPPGQTYTYATE